LRLRPEFTPHDAERKFDVGAITAVEPEICIAGEILQGLKKPHACEAFGTLCTPERPLGAPMVSSEGACATYFNAGRAGERRAAEAGCRPLCRRGLPGASLRLSHVLLAHGGGGKLTQRLIEQLLVPSFDNPALRELHDGAVLDIGGTKIAFSTDSFVVKPLFFPGATSAPSPSTGR